MIAATKIKSTRLSNRHTFYCALLILIYLSVAVAIAVEWQSKLTQHFMLDPVVFVSLGYFLVLLAASWKSLKVFYVLTPLVVLSVPNAVNDLFPSYAMGPTDERGASYFAFFTHIDIFVLFGLIVHGMRRELRPLYTLEVLGLSFLALCYFVGYVQALLGPERRLGVYAVWGFQYRYVFLAMAFVFLPTLGGRRNGFILAGLYVTALLVVTESVLFTELRLGGVFSHRLTSGNYGHNGYGNLLAAISASCYIQYCLTAKVSRRLRWILLILFTVFTSAAFFSDTRMSALSLAVGLVFFHILCWRRIRFSPITAVAIVLFLVVSPLVPSNMVGVGDYTKRTSCRHLAEVFESPDGLSSLFGVCNTVTGAEEEEEEEEEEYVTPQASTIQTRLVLWQGSLHMLQAYPMTGVGLGEWNFAKSQYNIEWKTLLDSHNDYLHFLAELGVPLGVLFAVALYFLPWLRAEMLRRQGIDTLFDVLPILTVPMVMSMSAFSNSNGHKHQIFMILIILGWVAWVREGAATSNSSIDRAIPTVTG